MKSKIILRQLHNEPIKQKINELGNMTQTEALLSNSMNSYHDEIYEFSNPQYQDRKASSTLFAFKFKYPLSVKETK